MQAPLSKAALIVGLICSVLAAAVPTLVLPQFRQAFESFGAELPLVTRLLLKYHFVMWAAPVAVMAAWRYWPNARRRPLAACLLGVGALVVAVPVIFIALYFPISEMAAGI